MQIKQPVLMFYMTPNGPKVVFEGTEDEAKRLLKSGLMQNRWCCDVIANLVRERLLMPLPDEVELNPKSQGSTWFV